MISVGKEDMTNMYDQAIEIKRRCRFSAGEVQENANDEGNLCSPVASEALVADRRRRRYHVTDIFINCQN